ncbi:MAG: GTP-binding protein [Planctomycetes bacterium]|nr:GTP-binding protein [Planctomycetota bacterium]
MKTNTSSTYAALITGKGTGAIAVIAVLGPGAAHVIEEIFTPSSAAPLDLSPGRILVGHIKTENKTIDQVTIGCESKNCFAINCHGNPLITTDLLTMLKTRNIKITTPKKLTALKMQAANANAIAIEAALPIPKAATLAGTKIIQYQTTAGLAKTLRSLLNTIETSPLAEIKNSAAEILENSNALRPLIFGCKTIITGPPNTGKSSLLNYLAGSTKSIVSEQNGTTRDYVTASCLINDLAFNFYDTAGLDKTITTDNPSDTPSLPSPENTQNHSIELTSQQRTLELLDSADLVIIVLDNSRPADQLTEELIRNIAAKKTLLAINKIDLPNRLDTDFLPKKFENITKISLKIHKNLEKFIKILINLIKIPPFQTPQVTCFTQRQLKLISQLTAVNSNNDAKTIINTLLDPSDIDVN